MHCDTLSRVTRPLLFILAATGLVASAGRVSLETESAKPPSASASERPSGSVSDHPFRVGERLTYRAKINILNAGTATMSVVGIEDIRGRPAYHTIFDIKGGILVFHVDDHYESWF